ncbi:hypothetical protein MMC30_003550 [Trapelia coarctata]|nr:hypothetical protein [Trapelia coarctata]
MALVVVFGLGFLYVDPTQEEVLGVCIISILRISSFFTITPEDLTYSKVPADIYSNLEPSLGIVCACLPIMRPIFDKLFPSIRRNSSERRIQSTPAPKGISTTGQRSEAYLRAASADDESRKPDEELGFSRMAVGNQDNARSYPVEKLDDSIVVTTEWEVERR